MLGELTIVDEIMMNKASWNKVARRYGVLATAKYMRDLGYPLIMTLWILTVKELKGKS